MSVICKYVSLLLFLLLLINPLNIGDFSIANAQARSHNGQVISIGQLVTDQGEPSKRSVLIKWNELQSRTRVTGNISDEQWEILKIAYAGSGKINSFSFKQNGEWELDLSTITTSKYGDGL